MISASISWCLPTWVAAVCFATASCSAPPPKTNVGDFAGARVAASWLFPLNPPSTGDEKIKDDTTPLHLPNSRLEFTEAQLNNLFLAPDWHPDSHSPMPEIVLHGRAPGTFACGYCHLPSGQGRPENAALAGLPTAYIVQQVADIKSGARRSAWHGGFYRPVDLMRQVAVNASDADVVAAAEYFSAQTLRPRVTVIERDRIPRMQVMGWVYVIDPRGGEESLGQRLIEWAPDGSRHEKRDDEMRYIAFVPPGSRNRGRKIAMTGQRNLTQPCTACHGAHLQGMRLIPPLAGRSPTYLLRQLVAFKTRDRAGNCRCAHAGRGGQSADIRHDCNRRVRGFRIGVSAR
jgi:cytochrome c553